MQDDQKLAGTALGLGREETEMQFIESHGAKIPIIGLGTWELRGRTCSRLIEQALRLGYRHIDTAQVYENEREVGWGIHASGCAAMRFLSPPKSGPTHFAPNDLLRPPRKA
ncbi:MAG: aldo/keto reductase [Rhodopseudomonas palustris]|nr:aldo/keto reductase [Rhodopseudomonas palustris]